MSIAHAIRYHQFGKPLDVLRYEEVEVQEPGPGQVQVRMLAAPINPSDFGMIGGSYGKLAELPAVPGREGVGEIISVGPGVDLGWVSRRVRFPDCGSWQTRANCRADDVWFIPEDVPLELAAMSHVNPPTAWRLLRDAYLQRGDWVIQNAGNSSVGMFVIQMAKHLGLKTISIVRREEVIPELNQIGADVVFLDNDDYVKQIEAATGGKRPQLALNMVGGESSIRLIKSLANSGRMVTFGGASFEPIRFPTRFFIFNDIVLKGFWMDRWYKTNSRERVNIMMSKIYAMMRDGTITAPVEASYPLSQFKEAIERSNQPRCGKIMLLPDPA
ncbi:MAG: 2-enoyl thioester reductase domain-containing protein [Opitutales bacterium]|nr:2-enoyl thioester reductase domain-containing protein [Opitutales bacterium]